MLVGKEDSGVAVRGYEQCRELGVRTMLVSEGEGSDIAFSGADGDVEAREFRGFRLWRDVGMSRKAIKPLQRLKGSSCLQKSSNLHSVVV